MMMITIIIIVKIDKDIFKIISTVVVIMRIIIIMIIIIIIEIIMITTITVKIDVKKIIVIPRMDR